YLHRLVERFNRARSGDYRRLRSADLGVPNPNYRVVMLQIAADQLVWLSHPDCFSHAGQVLELAGIQWARIAGYPDGGPVRPRHRMTLESQPPDDVKDPLNLVGGGVRTHNYEHNDSLYIRSGASMPSSPSARINSRRTITVIATSSARRAGSAS